VVDLSADYRLKDAKVFEAYYAEPPQDVKNLSRAVYGLPEVYGDKINAADLVANPGCYPQTAILGLLPLVANNLILPTGIIVNSCSGVSGAGRTPKLSTHFPECNESVSAYNVGKHRHTPEMEQVLSDVAGQPVEVVFTPHLVPMDRGIFSTIYATPTRTVTEEDLTALYRAHYAKAPFVRVRDTLLATKDTAFTNFLDVCIKVVRGHIVVLACEDNLVRGASGVAVQNFNRMFGYEETAGLL
jgi:N-acetyl-gamma-glutamyl-phosphate reductase